MLNTRKTTMNAVFIIAPYNYDNELKCRIPNDCKVLQNIGKDIIIEHEGSRIYIYQTETIIGEMTPANSKYITNLFPNPVFYAFEFRDINLCRKILTSIANDPNVLIDNDHDVCLPGNEFIQLLKNRPDWDWRLDPVSEIPDE